ncbi:MAG TPA: hypothetical protein PJ982_06785, partial [Lacipirellulaceae bacterium]|nr:hypothetical protein [Lacipirellulaceae bacterium]
MLVADQATGRIVALDEATGQFLRVVTAVGLDLPSSLSWGPGGSLYATNFGAYAGPGSAASVVKVDPDTGQTTAFIDDIGGPGAVGYDPVHRGDSLFVSKLADFVIVEGQPQADFSGNEVYQYDAAGERVAVIGAGSPTTGRSGIAFDGQGNLYVSEFAFFGVGSVLKYDGADGFAPLG